MAKAIINGQEIFGNVHIGEGGGASAEAVLDNGQISTTSSYATASFSDVSDYEFILIRFRDTVSSVDYTDYALIKVSDIGNGKTLTPVLHRTITCQLTTTSIASTNYSGSYYNIYADIVAFTDNPFDVLTGGN